jgi:hypothetical protein
MRRLLTLGLLASVCFSAQTAPGAIVQVQLK